MSLLSRLLPSRRRSSPWAGKDVSALVPVRLVDSRATEDPDRDELLVPRFRGGLAARWLQPRLPEERAHVRVRLDPRGTFLWRRVDGRTCIGELVGAFVAAFPDDARDAADRVWLFLVTLQRNGFIAFAGRADDPV